MNIDLTETEIIMILDCIGERIDDLNDELAFSGDPETVDQISALADLDMELREASARCDDDWDRNDEIPNAAAAMIEAGVEAREQMKLNRLMQGTQSVDVWSLDGLNQNKK